MKTVLITGISGEVGSSLALYLAKSTHYSIVGFDLREPSSETKRCCSNIYLGDISDGSAVNEMASHHTFDIIYHLAGVLSSSGERKPILAHSVNVTGTVNMLEVARMQTEQTRQPVPFVFTSTIAVYGMPSIEIKKMAGAIAEGEYLNPITMYGANKLYCESLGSYYAEHYGMLEGSQDRPRVDFRCVRFPGLLNSHTLPTGGTSDYAPEMVHAAAEGKAYECFVRADSRIPFLMMPDAINALVRFGNVEAGRLTQRVYNLGGFSPRAGDIHALMKEHFPNAKTSYVPHAARQKIVDSWPEDVDDKAAQRDWGWKPDLTFSSGFLEYLIPEVITRYQSRKFANG